MPHDPVQGNNQNQPTDGVDTWDDDSWYDADFDNPTGLDAMDEADDAETKKTQSGYDGTVYGGGSKNMGTGGTSAPGGDLGSPLSDPFVQQQIQLGLDSGKSPQQIVNELKAMGYTNVTVADVLWAQEQWGPSYPRGYGYGNGAGKAYGGAGGYPGGNPMGPLSKAYGSPYWNQYMNDMNMANDARDMVRDSKKSHKKQMMKIHMILLMIWMGDISGAIRAYAVLMDRDLRKFTRLMVNKLGKVRQARSRVIRNFGQKSPPRAYAGSNPGTAARAQDKASKYTQFVQLSTQLMNELQNTEREIMDGIQTMFRDMENFWQAYATMRDEKFRTDNRVMRIQ